MDELKHKNDSLEVQVSGLKKVHTIVFMWEGLLLFKIPYWYFNLEFYFWFQFSLQFHSSVQFQNLNFYET